MAVPGSLSAAREMEIAGDLRGAAEAYRQVTKSDPTNAQAWGRMGSCLMHFGSTEEAIACFQRASGLDRASAEWQEGIGRCLLALVRFDEAARALDIATSIEPRRASAWLAKAVAVLWPGKETLALEAVSNALRADPNLLGAKLMISRLTVQSGVAVDATLVDRRLDHMGTGAHEGNPIPLPNPERPDETPDPAASSRNVLIEVISQEVDFLPLLPRALPGEPLAAGMPPEQPLKVTLLRAATLLRGGDPRGALDLYDRILVSDPRCHHAEVGRAAALLFLSRPQESSQAAERAYEIAPDEPMAITVCAAIRAEQAPEEAIAMLDALLTTDPRIADAWQFRGMALTLVGRYDEAVESLRRALELDPEHGPAAAMLASLLFFSGSVPEGMRLYAKALHLGVEPTTICAISAEALANAGLKAEALSLLRAQPYSSAKDVGTLRALGRSFRGLGAYQEAIDCLRLAVERDHADYRSWEVLAQSLQAAGSGEEAVRTLVRAVSLRPQDPRLKILLATHLSMIGRREEAQRAALEALKLEPKSFRAHMILGSKFLEEGRRAEAISHFRSAYAIHPDPFSALSVAVELAGSDDAIEAEEGRATLRAAISRWPTEAGLWTPMGNAHYRTGDQESAYGCMMKAAHLDRSSTSAWLALADVLAAVGRFQEALGASQMAAHLSPRDPAALLSLGYAHFNLGQFDKSRGWAEELLRIAPTSGSAHLLKARLLHQGNWLAEAEREYDQALRLRPRLLDAMLGKAGLLSKQARWTDVASLCERALRVDPGNVTAANGLAYAVAMMGRRKDAERMLRDRGIPKEDWDSIIGVP
ncbi:MAG TPA: tetratricopeptide repeat protein [Thermoplasmata archaeon]|nr:tetratricopeptide repeat protein [Thermoplasmata archaeon]